MKLKELFENRNLLEVIPTEPSAPPRVKSTPITILPKLDTTKGGFLRILTKYLSIDCIRAGDRVNIFYDPQKRLIKLQKAKDGDYLVLPNGPSSRSVKIFLGERILKFLGFNVPLKQPVPLELVEFNREDCSLILKLP